MTRLRWLLWTGEALVVAVLMLMVAGLRINLSASMPVGVYWRAWHPPVLTRGQLVTVRLEGRALPLLKPVAGMVGDSVCREHDQLLIGDLDFGPFYPEAQAAIAEGTCLTVEPGSVFLASRVPRSYDSRYFGVVPVARLQGVLQPLLTW